MKRSSTSPSLTLIDYARRGTYCNCIRIMDPSPAIDRDAHEGAHGPREDQNNCVNIAHANCTLRDLTMSTSRTGASVRPRGPVSSTPDHANATQRRTYMPGDKPSGTTRIDVPRATKVKRSVNFSDTDSATPVLDDVMPVVPQSRAAPHTHTMTDARPVRAPYDAGSGHYHAETLSSVGQHGRHDKRNTTSVQTVPVQHPQPRRASVTASIVSSTQTRLEPTHNMDVRQSSKHASQVTALPSSTFGALDMKYPLLRGVSHQPDASPNTSHQPASPNTLQPHMSPNTLQPHMSSNTLQPHMSPNTSQPHMSPNTTHQPASHHHKSMMDAPVRATIAPSDYLTHFYTWYAQHGIAAPTILIEDGLLAGRVPAFTVTLVLHDGRTLTASGNQLHGTKNHAALLAMFALTSTAHRDATHTQSLHEPTTVMCEESPTPDVPPSPSYAVVCPPPVPTTNTNAHHTSPRSADAVIMQPPSATTNLPASPAMPPLDNTPHVSMVHNYVGIVNERFASCTHHGRVQYEDRRAPTNTHHPFCIAAVCPQYRVFLGYGSNKKAAKQDAARALLEHYNMLP